ncbi:FAD-dependent pyridine nucleotide-disulfide oxidoreductase [Nitrosococcus halophilus Nc 4]|uniref:FAD-dependent pyridine nucleotide-disulfide oxidoreductase n=1 Tax=Nitrosococcus halophilus (strain Nc4) TaxID=472759 RepID=D5C439_NITHN|nr:NAD(P)/FAD-dependent oxidoreductase [Nitrosococcus halophilus]ADE13227.1 FAD-dependent pyridine nucleotide-disulfide oxidoreductase [Nitrosococcus halophilus Nc 4]
MATEKAGNSKHKIIVVGGGAGGLQLATKLGKKLGKTGLAEIILIEVSPTHIWKPLLHEVAAGTLDSHEDEIEYLAQAAWSHFRYRRGRMDGLDRQKREISVAPTYNQKGEEIIPRRNFNYDTLIIAVGSVSNDFGITGVQEHCLFLDTTQQAEYFQRQIIESYLRAHARGKPMASGELDVAIVGGGATGIELAAQLHAVSRLFTAYGLEVKPADIKLSIIEAAPRLLPGLPSRISGSTEKQLGKLGVEILVNERVIEVTEKGIQTQSGRFIPARIKVWAAGIKAPDFLKDINGLETNKLNQLVLRPTLQTTRDENIFALGDCAACPWKNHEGVVPPRAQAAHQQAQLLYKNIRNQLEGKPLQEYHYRDYGSLVSLGGYSTVGNLMGNITGSIMIEGLIARLVYLSLYKMHQMALFGPFRTTMLTISHLFRRSVHPKIKLH